MEQSVGSDRSHLLMSFGCYVLQLNIRFLCFNYSKFYLRVYLLWIIITQTTQWWHLNWSVCRHQNRDISLLLPSLFNRKGSL
jgi:hypothetical protein